MIRYSLLRKICFWQTNSRVDGWHIIETLKTIIGFFQGDSVLQELSLVGTLN